MAALRGWRAGLLCAALGCQREEPVSPQASDPRLEYHERLLQASPEAASEFEDPVLRSMELVRHEDSAQVLALLALQPGESVGDIGCGIGFYSFSLSQAVGAQGLVYAVDVKAEYLDIVRRRAQQGRTPHPENMRFVLGQEDDARLEPQSLDVALLAHLDFHAVRPMGPERHARMLRSVFDALRPGGRLVVVQWMGVGPGFSVDNSVANLEDAGFQLAHKHAYAEYSSWGMAFHR